VESMYQPELSDEELKTVSKMVGGPGSLLKVPTEDLVEALRYHFNKVDFNKSGALNVTELHAVLSQNFSIPAEKIEEILVEANTQQDSNGVVR